MSIRKLLRTQWDRCGAVVLALAGLLGLFLGWLGSSRTSFPAEQIPYLLSGGLFGLSAIAIGATLWISADLRDEWRKLDEVKTVVGRQTEAIATFSQPQRTESGVRDRQPLLYSSDSEPVVEGSGRR